MAERTQPYRTDFHSSEDVASRAPRQKVKKKRFLSLFLWGLVFVLLSCAGIVWFIAQTENATADLSVLRPEVGPFKVKPVDASGMDITTSNTTVLGMLEGKTETAEETEVLALQGNQPELPPVTTKHDGSEPQALGVEPNSSKGETKLVPTKNPSLSIQTITAERLPQEGGSVITLDNKINRGLSTDNTQNGEAKTESISTPLSRPKGPNRVPSQQVIKPDISNSVSFMVQLAAFRDREKAETAAALLTGKHEKRLMQLTLGVMQVVADNSTMFWRVITEPLPAPDARSICDNLKRAGQDCILRKVKPARP